MPDVEQVQEEPSLREVLSEQYDKLEKASTEATEPATEAQAQAEPEAPAAEPASPSGRVRGPDGKFVAKGETPPPKETQDGVVPGTPLGQSASGPPNAATPPAPAVEIRLPQSWKPAVRELASKLPAEFRPILEESIRRDRETALAVQRATETRQAFDPLIQTLQPYAQGLAQRGLNVTQVLGNMLRTEQTLASPDVRVRAQVLAEALRTYNVPVEALAAAIDGTAPAPAAPSVDPQQLAQQVEQRILGNLQQQREQVAWNEASAELESFEPEAEFWDESTQFATGTILQAAADKGLAMSVQEAYEQACWANPEVRPILQQREASKQAATNLQATQRAHAAGSSVRSTPGGPAKDGPTGDGWREHLEAAAAKRGW